ncbi:MAG: dephospho-CoA kinase, partial [Limisphaerales bacterium]
RIRSAWKQWVAERSKEGAGRAIVVIPLLFETGAEKELDLTICVACSINAQHSRLQKRGWGDEEIAKRIAAQLPIREKMDKANRVVWNEAGLDICELQVSRIFRALEG